MLQFHLSSRISSPKLEMIRQNALSQDDRLGDEGTSSCHAIVNGHRCLSVDDIDMAITSPVGQL
jgi:hypothetical protein